MIRTNSKKPSSWLLITMVALWALAGCSQEPAGEAGGRVTEYTAILANLEASRQEIRELRGDIALLRQEVNGIRAGAVAPSGAAPGNAAAPAPAVTELQLTAGSPEIGAANARYAIVEFTDYECPFCGRFNQNALPQIQSNYVDKGTVKIITRDFPLEFHANAQGAALAANCAAEQGAYEAMRAGLFAAQTSLGPSLYQQLATANGLEMGKFEQCINNASNAQRIRDDIAYGGSLGVTGTPSFFIGRIDGDKLVDVVPLVGALPYESFAAAIDPLLPEG